MAIELDHVRRPQALDGAAMTQCITEDRNGVYAYVESRGLPFTLSGAWGRFTCLNGFFRLRQDPSQLFDGLRESFSAEHLLGSGVVVTSDNGTLALHPKLAIRDSILFAPREAPDHRPFDIWADGTSLGRLWPALTVFRDYRAAALLARRNSRLLVAFSMADVAILLSLGIPATLPDGLDRFFGRQLDLYCRRFGIQRHVADQALEEWFLDLSAAANEGPQSGPSLTLVGWSIAGLELARPPELAAIQDHFARIDHQMGIRFVEEQIWTATNDDIERLRFALAHGDYFDLVRVFADSVDDRSTELVPIASATPVTHPAPQSYAEARLNWETSQKQSASSEQRKQAWDHLHDFHERDVITPLWRMAMEATDALDRARILAVIDLSRLAHSQALIMTAQLEKSFREGGTCVTTVPKEAFQQFVLLIDRIRGLTPEKKSWRQRGQK